MDNLAKARLIALIAPLALLGGALISQHVGGLHPCEMCYWQRWPHEAAIALAVLAILLRKGPAGVPLLALAAVAILVSGAIGVFHAGVEYRWWEGLTTCSTSGISGGSTADILKNIMATPVVRCDQTQWELFGISLAGFNAIFSIGAALLIFGFMAKARRV